MNKKTIIGVGGVMVMVYCGYKLYNYWKGEVKSEVENELKCEVGEIETCEKSEGKWSEASDKGGDSEWDEFCEFFDEFESENCDEI
ncbi:CLUMA_CG004216, isoform A [Clunio marinus]|uniref:CLUMA_CG004216, isoform A n=1 Tax=Clunio marinus TaxID=568069 RepID=A0A1J1HR33_9DIPT|nr:CLUMA_CG004216, isoform A [Clunio marinus]